jgi:hypothetical protein
VSTATVTWYELMCDYPGCHHTSTDPHDLTPAMESQQAADDAAREGWTSDGRHDYCPCHAEQERW